MKTILIDTFSRLLLGSKIWGEIQGIVNICEDSTLTGPQKRSLALEHAQALGISVAGFLLNLGLELAVAYLKFRK